MHEANRLNASKVAHLIEDALTARIPDIAGDCGPEGRGGCHYGMVPSGGGHLADVLPGGPEPSSRTLADVGSPDVILIVEDDASLREILRDTVATAGYVVEVVGDGIAAAQRLRVEPTPTIVLLDIGLPFVDGWQILAEIEGRRQPSVIVISARGEERDKVRALDLGADDYITKPFGAEELLARIRAVLRRIEAPSGASVVRCGDVTIDLARKRVDRGDVEVRLSPTEWVLLAELAGAAGSVVDHRRLLGRVWGPQYVGDREYLRTFILRLRRKLEADPTQPTVITTAGRNGYRLNVT